MPILNFDPTDTNLPDLAQPQQCDSCGAIYAGSKMLFAYHPEGEEVDVQVICGACIAAELAKEPTVPCVSCDTQTSAAATAHGVVFCHSCAIDLLRHVRRTDLIRAYERAGKEWAQ